jgi:predicted amidophosphoribosyltransferase
MKGQQMTIELWYCPKCDKDTQNWRTCRTCGTPAVFQKFMLWPVPANVKAAQ